MRARRLSARSAGIAAAALCVLLAGCQRRDAPAASGGPVVVLVSLDTLRADRLEIYGSERDTAPRLAELARDSVVFHGALAQASQTLLSHKSLLAAKRPLRLLAEETNAGVEEIGRFDRPHRIVVDAFRSAESGSLLELLRESGYRTAAFTDGGWMKESFGFDEGFDRFDSTGGRLRSTVKRGLRWLRRDRARPAFLFLHGYDAHCPYVTREPFDSLYCLDHSTHVDLEGKCGKGENGLASMPLTETDLRAISDHYDGGIASLDVEMGKLIDGLRTEGLYDDALVIVTSDHGEALGEHGQIGHGGLYLEQLRVPLLIKFPAALGPGHRDVDSPVELVDLMPTVLEVAGIEPPAGLDGRSLLPLAARGAAVRRHAVAQIAYREGPSGITDPGKRALYEPGRWLFIDNRSSGASELFDLAADPLGLRDVAASRPAEVERLREALRSHDPAAPSAEVVTPEEEELSEEVERELRALGYLGN